MVKFDHTLEIDHEPYVPIPPEDLALMQTLVGQTLETIEPIVHPDLNGVSITKYDVLGFNPKIKSVSLTYAISTIIGKNIVEEEKGLVMSITAFCEKFRSGFIRVLQEDDASAVASHATPGNTVRP